MSDSSKQEGVIRNTLVKIRDALLGVNVPVYHYKAKKQTDRYIVWAEDDVPGSTWADDLCIRQTIQGTADYFTRTEYDPNVEAIQAAMNNMEIVWQYNSIQYEEDTGYIHHEWVWEVST